MTPSGWHKAVGDLESAQNPAAARNVVAALRLAKGAIPPPENLATLSATEILSYIDAHLAAIGWKVHLREAGQRIYSRAAGSIAKLVGGVVDYPVVLDNPRELYVHSTGGTRLARLEPARNRRVTGIIAAMRSEGAHPRRIAKMLETIVPAGPFSSPEVRAKVIARTEVRFAQNVSTLAICDQVGVGMVQILDGQLPTSDDFCRERHGSRVTLVEAREMMEKEHPNGTLDYFPVVGN